MPFPKNNLLPNPENPLLSEMLQKRIGFSPLVICDFYEGFEVLQIYGNESKEYIFGNYWNGNFVGFIYLGDKWDLKKVTEICEIYMPKKWDEIWDYHIKYGDKIWYHKYPNSHYAFVMEKTLKKLEK